MHKHAICDDNVLHVVACVEVCGYPRGGQPPRGDVVRQSESVGGLALSVGAEGGKVGSVFKDFS